jgi:hypothetical protein
MCSRTRSYQPLRQGASLYKRLSPPSVARRVDTTHLAGDPRSITGILGGVQAQRPIMSAIYN